MILVCVQSYVLISTLPTRLLLLVRLPLPWDGPLTRRTFPLPEKTVYLPSFETDKKGERANDRFAYGSMFSMGVSKRFIVSE